MLKPATQQAVADANKKALGTAEQVAEYLGVPVATLYAWRHRGVGPRASKVGRHLRYRWIDVERYLDQQAEVA
jgi:excisionase family DNA binding protein